MKNDFPQKNVPLIRKKVDTERNLNTKEIKPISNKIVTNNIKQTKKCSTDIGWLSEMSIMPELNKNVPQIKVVESQKKAVMPQKQALPLEIKNVMPLTKISPSPTNVLNQTKKVKSPTTNIVPLINIPLFTETVSPIQKKPIPIPQKITNLGAKLETETVVKNKNTVCDSVNITNNKEIKITKARNKSHSTPIKRKTTTFLPLSNRQKTIQIIKNAPSTKRNMTFKEMAEKFTSIIMKKELKGLKVEFETNFLNCKLPNNILYQDLQKNENKNITPNVPLIDNTRVVLKNSPIDNNYINANYVATGNNRQRLILTQYPMNNTVEDFFQMIIQENVKYVIQLANIDELGDSLKGAEYIPKNKTINIKNINIFNVNETISKLDKNIKITEIMFKCNGKEYNFKHFLWIKWPQKGCPNPWELTAITIYDYVSKSTSPILIHCRSGIRRSGIVAAIFMAIDDFNTYKMNENMIDIVKNLRNSRALCINIVVDYYFLHLQLIHYFLKKNFISNSQQLMELMDDYDPANKKQAEFEKKKSNVSVYGNNTLEIKNIQ
ncbi:Protein-tyrosine phosphatase, receptor/non-receptor type domain and Protein-tyrosine/Dual specificity phosphatase domain and Protein-tyrosine phosphatase, catalytic domain-containing protein [Strongyloides ratti]|uniref:Protein-tyrosine phosphatase, receptor/non-receptor type domain and Protein-tyrosine/Dual specificity phosphatase domain and Protein-tyrosine phosphatase, catalytic domain-containing protein n=1 Tax=Strongyloides ratti TaxID=34506 RepID=A0A090MX42_STRRB|nr:Protein-tyrosine phosphatase, receptor/non-receptor type domain and Protein-tyrosine/Dual specificity phosphatase domain and Protein-tyrosine phosphatase, catalytic domain-containing protein [Strongyloides ratti]CEF64779.1 Protein-tyrosine phosphatase, receptor/non-receptor type domain and Protein-tyrosine/Dual specificity phosphatase domain and Protein-tyrosine phosphatase, catalytic domain-containing protein [Strongyloides ratti]